MNKKLKCYFAHPWDTRGSEEEKRIIKALEDRRVEVCNPFDGEEGLWAKYNRKAYYPNPPYKLGREIWILDLHRVKMCDMLVAYLPHTAMCTAVELAEAYRLEKFIQVISPMKHPLIAYVLDRDGKSQLFKTVEQFEKLKPQRWDND